MKIYVFDIETSINSKMHGPDAKDPINDFHTLIWGSHPDEINIRHSCTGCRSVSASLPKEILECDLLIGHNLPFDLAYVIKDLPSELHTWDTQIAEYLMSGQRHAFSSLAELQEIYLGRKIKKDRISYLFKNGIGADKIVRKGDKCPRLWALYNQYCKDDGKTTLEIFKLQYARAKKMNMLGIIKLYNAFMVTLVRVMSEGINVDMIGTEKTIQELKLKSLSLLAETTKYVSKHWIDPRLPEFNIASSDHKSALLFGGVIKCKIRKDEGFYQNGNPKSKIVEELVPVSGFQLNTAISHRLKKEGLYATDRAVIEDVYKTSDDEEVKDYCRLQLEAMNCEKLISTYLKPFLEYSIDGKLYPHYNNTAVITGRLSSKKPNLQNIPTKGESWKKIQGQLVAPSADWLCVSIDYSQLEMWIAAWNSKDPQLINDLKEGLDFHCQSLGYASGKSYEEVYKLCMVDQDPEWVKRRKTSKAITFQKEYGAGHKKIALSTGLPEDVVKNTCEKLDAKYSMLTVFKDYIFKTASENMSYSNIKHLPSVQRKGGINGRKFDEKGNELLPILGGKYKEISDLNRNVGYYQMPHGKLYSFEEFGYISERGLRQTISVPQTKNYLSQGGAADVMAATSVQLMTFCLENKEKVKFIHQIHDANNFYVKKEYISLIIPKLCSIMEHVPDALRMYFPDIKLDFNFKVEASIGPNFAEMNKYEQD